MTEIYHGPWSPLYGDTPKKAAVQKVDPYHPAYPAVKTDVKQYVVNQTKAVQYVAAK